MSTGDLITAAEAADRKDCHVRTIHRAVDAGLLAPAHKLPGLRGAYLFDPIAVDDLVLPAEQKAAS